MKKSELEEILRDVAEVRRRYGHLDLYRVQPDWGSSGIWMPKQIGSIALGPNLFSDDFAISDGAKDLLAQWHDIRERDARAIVAVRRSCMVQRCRR